MVLRIFLGRRRAAVRAQLQWWPAKQVPPGRFRIEPGGLLSAVGASSSFAGRNQLDLA
jgi:hypothetical protein